METMLCSGQDMHYKNLSDLIKKRNNVRLRFLCTALPSHFQKHAHRRRRKNPTCRLVRRDKRKGNVYKAVSIYSDHKYVIPR